MFGRFAIAATIASVLAFASPAFAQSMPAGVKVTGGIFVNASGMTLYTTDNDKELNKSACTGQCVANWPILAAPADSKAMGDWTVVTRDDSTKQWAYKGKPLYIFARDVKAGDMTGDGRGPWHTAKP